MQARFMPPQEAYGGYLPLVLFLWAIWRGVHKIFRSGGKFLEPSAKSNNTMLTMLFMAGLLEIF
jgi:hypothetical protein